MSDEDEKKLIEAQEKLADLLYNIQFWDGYGDGWIVKHAIEQIPDECGDVESWIAKLDSVQREILELDFEHDVFEHDAGWLGEGAWFKKRSELVNVPDRRDRSELNRLIMILGKKLFFHQVNQSLELLSSPIIVKWMRSDGAVGLRLHQVKHRLEQLDDWGIDLQFDDDELFNLRSVLRESDQIASRMGSDYCMSINDSFAIYDFDNVSHWLYCLTSVERPAPRKAKWDSWEVRLLVELRQHFDSHGPDCYSFEAMKRFVLEKTDTELTEPALSSRFNKYKQKNELSFKARTSGNSPSEELVFLELPEKTIKEFSSHFKDETQS